MSKPCEDHHSLKPGCDKCFPSENTEHFESIKTHLLIMEKEYNRVVNNNKMQGERIIALEEGMY